MITSNRVNLSILLSTFALNPKEVDLNERKLISECVFGRKIWWLEYHYQDLLNLNESEIENYDKIVFCRRLLVLLGDLKAWTEKYKFESFRFPGFDNNSEDDGENICATIIDLFLKYESERFSHVGITECPTSPGAFLFRYHKLVDTYWDLVEKPLDRQDPGRAGVEKLISILKL